MEGLAQWCGEDVDGCRAVWGVLHVHVGSIACIKGWCVGVVEVSCGRVCICCVCVGCDLWVLGVLHGCVVYLCYISPNFSLTLNYPLTPQCSQNMPTI